MNFCMKLPWRPLSVPPPPSQTQIYFQVACTFQDWFKPVHDEHLEQPFISKMTKNTEKICEIIHKNHHRAILQLLHMNWNWLWILSGDPHSMKIVSAKFVPISCLLMMRQGKIALTFAKGLFQRWCWQNLYNIWNI